MESLIIYALQCIFVFFIIGSCWYILSSELLFEKYNKYAIIANATIIAITNTTFIFLSVFGIVTFSALNEFMLNILQMLIMTLTFLYLKKQNCLKVISAVILPYFFLYNFVVVIYGVLSKIMPIEFLDSYFNTPLILLRFSLCFGFFFLMLFIFKKLKFRAFFNTIFQKPIISLVFFSATILLRVAYFLYWYFFLTKNNYSYLEVLENNTSILFGSIFTVISLVFILFMVAFQATHTRIQAQEALILQQQNYLQTLESMQKKMRAFRHDLQNLLAGMYLQAKDNNSEQVQQFLKKSIKYFDEQIGSEIKQMAYLSNVDIIEIKSLLLVKLIQAEKMQVTCNLEIINPINEVYMGMGDFIRCLGILIDNALEAAANQTDKSVSIVLLSELQGITIIVRNPVEQPVALHLLLQDGHTTKGKNRGEGLSIYRMILGQYPNAFTKCYYKENHFTQELIIRRKV